MRRIHRALKADPSMKSTWCPHRELPPPRLSGGVGSTAQAGEEVMSEPELVRYFVLLTAGAHLAYDICPMAMRAGS